MFKTPFNQDFTFGLLDTDHEIIEIIDWILKWKGVVVSLVV